jgi:hypothetical protein
MLRRCALLFAAASAFIVRPAHAEIGSRNDAYEAGYDPGKQQRRSDFTAGIAWAPIALGGASGYPNEVAKIGDPKYEASTGFGGGVSTAFWLGVAFRDWLVFGVGFRPYTLLGKECNPLSFDDTSEQCVRSQGAVFMTHIEAFPFFYMAPALQNLAVFTELGAGGRLIKKGHATIADGGVMSFVSLGVAYEPINLWNHLSLGPFIQGSHEFSETLKADQFVLGFRGVYYGGP